MPAAILSNPEFTEGPPQEPVEPRTTTDPGGAVWIDYSQADRGPVVKTTRTTSWNDKLHRWNTRTDYYVISEVVLIPGSRPIYRGAKLSAKGEADRRHISPIGGLRTHVLFLSRHEQPEVIGFLRGTWGRA